MLYSKLSAPGQRVGSDKATVRLDMVALMKKKGMSRAKLSELSGVPNTTVCAACRGETITLYRAEQIAKALERDCSSLFDISKDTPKTASSDRYITLPVETMQLLREYREHQRLENIKADIITTDNALLFSQADRSPMHPDSVNDWLNKFSERHGLPHINPHAFRHSMASLLYFNGVDSVSISKRLGHAQVSTTQNIYAHIIKDADQRNADIISDIFLKRQA